MIIFMKCGSNKVPFWFIAEVVFIAVGENLY